MKAILEFDLNNIESDDRIEFQHAIDGPKMHNVLWEMDQWLRKQYKYMPDNEYSEDKYNAYYAAREYLLKLLNEEGIKLD